MPKYDQLCHDKIVKDSYKRTKQLEKVTSNNDYKPEIKELEFVKKSQFLPVLVPVNMRLKLRLFSLHLMMLTQVSFHLFLVCHIIFWDWIHLFPWEKETGQTDDKNGNMDADQGLLACFFVFDSTGKWIRLKWWIDVGKALERIRNCYSPIETRIGLLVFVGRYVSNNILDLKVHVLDILQKLFHLSVVVLLKVDGL